MTVTVTAQCGAERITRTFPSADGIRAHADELLDETGASFVLVAEGSDGWVVGADGSQVGPVAAVRAAEWTLPVERLAPVRHLRLVQGGVA